MTATTSSLILTRARMRRRAALRAVRTETGVMALTEGRNRPPRLTVASAARLMARAA